MQNKAKTSRQAIRQQMERRNTRLYGWMEREWEREREREGEKERERDREREGWREKDGEREIERGIEREENDLSTIIHIYLFFPLFQSVFVSSFPIHSFLPQ